MSGFVLSPDDGDVISPEFPHATFASRLLPANPLVTPPPPTPATALAFSTPPVTGQVNVASTAGRVSVNGSLPTPKNVTLSLLGVPGSITPSSFTLSDATVLDFTYTVTATGAGTGTVTASAPGLTSAQHSITVSGSAPTYIDLPKILYEMDPSRAFGVANVQSSPSGLAYNSSNRTMNIYGNLETNKLGVVNCDVTGRAPTPCPLAAPAGGSQGFDGDEIFFNTLGNATGQAYAPIKRLTAANGANPTGVACYQFEIDKVKHGWASSGNKNRCQLKQTWGSQATSLSSPWGTEFWSAFMVWLPPALNDIAFGWWILHEMHASDSGGLAAGGGLGYDLDNAGSLGMYLHKKLEVYTGPWPNAVAGSVSPVSGYGGGGKNIYTLPFSQKCWIITNWRECPGKEDPALGKVYGPTAPPYNGFCDTYIAVGAGSAVLVDRWPASGNKDGQWCSPYDPDHTLVTAANVVTSIEPGASAVNSGNRLRPTQYPDIGIYCTNSWPNAAVQSIKVFMGKFFWLRTQDQPNKTFGAQDVLYKIRGS